MSSILTIAHLTLRSLGRSRVFLSLVIVVLLAVVLVPFTIKGDGTLYGQVRISLHYSLWSVSSLLFIVTIWAACRVAAGEIEERQMHMLVTKPVHRGQIWVGKWLGIMLMNTALVILAGAGTYGLLRWQLRPSTLTQEEQRELGEEILIARAALVPRPDDLSDTIRPRVEDLIASGHMPGYTTFDQVPRSLLARVSNTVRPGETKRWVFDIVKPPPLNKPLFVRFHFSSPTQIKMEPLSVQWQMGSPETKDNIGHTYNAKVFAGAPHSFEIPPSLVQQDTFSLEFVNTGEHGSDVVMFDMNGPIQLLVQSGSFVMNLGKALFVMICQLSVFAALGLTAGSLFSTAVATFVSLAAIVLFSSVNFIHKVATASGTSSYRPLPSVPWLDAILRTEFKVLDVLLSAFGRYDVLPLLPRGQAIPWSFVAGAVGVYVVCYVGAIALLGIWRLSKRELGLPIQ